MSRWAVLCTSLFIHYSLVIGTLLPFCNAGIIHAQVNAQVKTSRQSGSATLPKQDVEEHHRLTQDKLRSMNKRPDRPINPGQRLNDNWSNEIGSTGAPRLTEEIMGFANSEASNDLSRGDKKSPAKPYASQQDSLRPTPTPPVPGIGSGGRGPDGSFNVEPPKRVHGAPPGLRSAPEVVNEARTQPTIPDPIPSSSRYCWPRDPSCRKKPSAERPSPAPKPTPPPRPRRSSVEATQSNLLVASNSASYLERLLSDAPVSLVDLLKTFSPAPADSNDSVKTSDTFVSKSAASPAKSGSASYIWADCNNVEGYADYAQGAVYIYVDGFNIGNAWVEGNGYFIYDISFYVNDGGYHNISAWYYTYDFIWVEAGSTAVSGCNPNPTYDFENPRLDSPNDTGDPGVNPASQNINWSVPLVGLPGRGLDLSLLLTYNSLVWIKSADGAAILYDADHGFPSPGFRLRFPIIQPLFFNPQVGVWSYMLVTSTGARTELRPVDTNTYESADSSYMRLVDQGGGNAVVWLNDGTQMAFEASTNGESRCREIKDRNGNFIKVDYNPAGNIDKVTDTLGRQVFFNYDGNDRLLTLSQTRTGLVNTLVTFGYENVAFSPNFPGLTVFSPTTSTIPVLTQVGFPDGSRYNFEYTTFGQVNKIRRHEADNRLLSYVRYNLGTGAQSDCPRFSEERVWAENWNDGLEAVTTYSGNVSTGESNVTTPDGVIHKQFYHTTGWRDGLVERTQTWFGGVQRKRTEMYWTQDNEGLSYQLNPRANDIRVFDEVGNQRRTTTEYTLFGLPSNVREYSGASVVRRRETQYRFDEAFVSRRILGVVWMELVYEGESTLVSKLNFHHDWNDSNHFNGQIPSTGHDSTNYGPGFVWGRANVTGIRRYNLAAPNDDNQAVWIVLTGYNAAGSAFLVRDAANHSLSISYADSFSDGINRGTLAYPTSVTDAENFVATTKYHYDMGAGNSH